MFDLVTALLCKRNNYYSPHLSCSWSCAFLAEQSSLCWKSLVFIISTWIPIKDLPRTPTLSNSAPSNHLSQHTLDSTKKLRVRLGVIL